MRIFLLALLIFTHLNSNYPDGDRRGNLSLIHLESASTTIIDGCVNAITGEFFQASNDLQIAGTEQLLLERYLGEKLQFSYDEHSWEYFGFNIASKLYLSANPAIRDGNGALIDFQQVQKHGDRTEYHLNHDHVKFGVTNFSGELLGRKNHLRFAKTFINKSKTHACLELPNGTQRVYEKVKLVKGSEQLLPTRENRPSGAYVEYGYVADYGISSVKLKARNGEVLNSIRFEYPRKKELKNNPYFDAIGSNGQKVRYHLLQEKKNVLFNITKVEKSHAPNEHIKVKYNDNTGCNELVRVKYPDCRFREAHLYHYGKQDTRDGQLKIVKNGNNDKNGEMFVGRVHKLRAPVGTDAFAVTTHEFIYNTPLFLDRDTNTLYSGRGSTSVFDAHSHKTCYHWNDSYQLDKIEKFTGTKPYSLHHTEYFRYDKAGQLTQRYFDKTNEGVLFCRQFIYDQYGDVVEDQLWGNLTGKKLQQTVHMSNGVPEANGVDVYTKRFRYTTDRFHNVCYETDGVVETHYEYEPGTDTLTAKFCGPVGQIEAREFYQYNARGELICTFCDDGSTRDVNNLQGVYCRKIERRELTNGLPTLIDEKFLDLTTGQELLHSRKLIRYSPTGKPLEEEFYDANCAHLYTLHKEYDAHDNVIFATDQMGIITTFAYDKNDNMICQEREGVRKINTYDFSNRLIKEEVVGDGALHCQTSRYDTLSQKTSSIDAWGNQTLYTYDDFGRPTQEVAPAYLGPDGSVIIPTISRTYDSTGNVAKLITPSGYEIYSAYNVRGDLIHSWDKDGTLQRCEYSLNGWLVKKTERSGLETRYTHDFLGRVIREDLYDSAGTYLRGISGTYKGVLKLSEVDTAGIETKFSYDFRGQCIAKETAGTVTTYGYDTQGRIIFEQLGDSVKTTTYDHLNRPVEEIVDGVVVKRTYDACGRVTKEQQGETATLTSYNALGDPIQITDGEGRTTIVCYNDDFINDLGQKVRLITHTYPNGTRTETEYNALGKVKRQTTFSDMGETLQHSLSFYDHNEKLAEVISTVISVNRAPYERKVCFQYDPQGRLVSVRDAAGAPEQKTTLYFYNTLGQKISEKQPNEFSINYTYDVFGRLSTLISTDETVSYFYSYDGHDNVIAVEDLIHGVRNLNTYDTFSQLTEETLGNGLKMKYSYDAIGRMTAMTLPDDSVVTYTYQGIFLHTVSKGDLTHTYTARNSSGKSIEEVLPYGGIRRTVYSGNGQKLEIATANFHDKVMERDLSGNVLQRSLQGKTQNYKWDLLHQLKEENGLNYSHDSLYNRTQIGKNQYALNSLNQVLSDGQNDYRYDSNGNLTHGREMQLVYDALNRLVSIETPNGKVEYRYDAQNRRISTIAEETTHYFYFGMNELGAISPSKKELRVFGGSEGAERGAGVLFELNGEVYIPLYDLTGNVSQLRDKMGNIIEEYTYDLSGVETFSNAKSPWRFSSKRVDAETGFVYFGFRYYDPLLGRWITADPRGYTAGPNLYAYVMNNPIAHMDQYGHIAESVGTQSREFGKKVIRFGKKRIVAWGLKLFYVERPEAAEPLDSTKSTKSSKIIEDHLIYSDGECRVFALFKDKEPGNHFSAFVNGVGNTIEQALESAKLISMNNNNCNVFVLDNPTEGLFWDLAGAGGLIFGRYDKTCRNVEAGYRYLFNKYPNKFCIAYAHSKGVLINSRVFKMLPKEMQRMIFSINLGGAHVIPPEDLAGAMNFVSKRDGVSYLTTPWELTRHAFNKRDYIYLLNGTGFYGCDHMFSGETYQEALKTAATQISNKFR